MTSQDIREMTFEKAVFGGYDMGTVDTFLDNVAAEFAAIQKENAALKGKLRVLVEKVEECRASEDSIRMAILSAQKASSQMIADAEARRDVILAEAEDAKNRAVAEARAEQKEVLDRIKNEIAEEEAKLAEAKSRSAQFIESVRALLAKQMSYLEQVGDVTPFIMNEEAAPEAKPADDVAETVKAIEETVARVADLPVADVTVETENAADSDVGFEPTRQFSFVREDSVFPSDDSKPQMSFDNFSFDN